MKILLIQLRKLGDVITTTPATRQLRKAFPTAQIDFLTEDLGANVYKNNPNKDNLITIKRKPTFTEYINLIKKLRKEKYDVVIDFFSNPKSAQICLFSAIKKRYGYKKGFRDIAYTSLIDLEKKVTETSYHYTPYHKLFLLEDIMKPDYSDISIELYAGEKEHHFANEFTAKYNITKEKTIAMCVVSEREEARIPYDFYVDIANRIISKGYNIYFVYGPSEREQVDEVYKQISDKTKCIVDYKMTTILENKEILGHCKGYIGNDGGTKHISVAANIPTLTFFHRDVPTRWTPPNDNRHRGVHYESRDILTKELIEEFLKIQ